MTNRLRLLLLILALGMMAIPVPAAGQEPGPIYTVQAGDTLSAIARRFGISQEALISANAIADPSRLFPGQALVLPGFPGIQGELALRTVELGETLTTLSRLYSVSPQDLARLNHMVRDDTAFVGQDMIVPVQAEAMGLSGVAFNRLTQPGDTRLELAAQSGLSPWLGSTEAFGALRYWQLPGTLSYGIGEPDSKGFPSQIEDFSLVPLPLIQGRTTIFQVGIQEGYTLSGSLGDADLTFFPSNDGRWVALQGIHAMAEPGLLDLHITVTQADTLETVFGFSQRLMIEEGDYGFQYLNGVPPETVDQAYTQPEEELIRALLAPKTETKLWDGAFDYPSRYYTEEFVSIFGTRRNYNNGALLYYHTGLDFYGQNVPIYAPADGVVVFADSLNIRGNATYLDHGWGVYSGYLHQNEIYVEVGDRVERGQVIGLVGMTGRATGPHLHWEIWVGGVPVEPLEWLQQAIP